MSIGLSVQKKKKKIDFKDGDHGGHLGILIGTILAIFDVLVTPMLPTKFQVSWSFGSGEEVKINFQDGRHLEFLIRLILATFHLPQCFLLSFKSVGFLVQKKKRKVDFQFRRHDGHLGFSVGTILTVFDLQVTPMFPTELQINWPLVPEKQKLDVQDSRYSSRHGHGGYFGFPIGTILAIFDQQVTPMLPTKFHISWPFGSGLEKKKKKIFKMAAMAAILDFRSERFKLFLVNKSPPCLLPSFKSIGFLVQEKKRKIDFQDGCPAASLDLRSERFLLFLIYKLA